MLLYEIANLLNAEVLTPGLNINREIDHAFSSDLMSDVLTRDYVHTVLITGLTNVQSIRTAEMSDIGQVIFGRDKFVSEELISLAEECDIVILRSEFSVYKISGMLYKNGIKPIF